jgi:hypothetical protein
LEPASLLVVEGHDPERTRGLDPFCLQRADDVERGQHAKGPVVAASARHGVEVGAEEDSLPLPRVPAAEYVSRRVELGLEAELLETRDEPFVGLLELVRPGKAGHAAFIRADLRGRFDVSRERGHFASSASGRARRRP